MQTTISEYDEEKLLYDSDDGQQDVDEKWEDVDDLETLETTVEASHVIVQPQDDMHDGYYDFESSHIPDAVTGTNANSDFLVENIEEEAPAAPGAKQVGYFLIFSLFMNRLKDVLFV